MVLVIGHRGAAGYEPENTLISFKRALKLKVDMVEFDVWKCKSGEIVVIHDELPKRTMKGNKNLVSTSIRKLSYAQIKTLKGDKGQHIPLLDEVLDVINKKVRVNIEIKDKNVAKDVIKIIHNRLRQGWRYEHFIVSSFIHSELKKILKEDFMIRRGALIEKLPKNNSVKQFLALKPYAIEPSLKFVNKAFVDDAHSRLMKVFVWTVNEKEDIKRIKKMGVDGVFSNFPDRI